ncbi:MAG: hypothetical protein PHD68_06770 [Rugosibacter sp.]|nr:hypothetical protein [Rugosibacter sp.]
MRIYENITPALTEILRSYRNGYTHWVSFFIDKEKVPAIGEKWSESYGTLLPPWKRNDRKHKNLPLAVAYAAPVLSRPGALEVILMAWLPENAPVLWRENWRHDLPTYSEFVLVKEPNSTKKYVWTWKLQDRVLAGIEKHLIVLVKSGEASAVRHETEHMIKLYPMFSGVRRQIRRLFRSATKLWLATSKLPWLGPDPENLPAMIGFRKYG